MRVVEDYDVDRRQVQAWRHAQPSRTNHPKSFRVLHAFNAGAAERKHHAVRLRRWRARRLCVCRVCVGRSVHRHRNAIYACRPCGHASMSGVHGDRRSGYPRWLVQVSRFRYHDILLPGEVRFPARPAFRQSRASAITGMRESAPPAPHAGNDIKVMIA